LSKIVSLFFLKACKRKLDNTVRDVCDV